MQEWAQLADQTCDPNGADSWNGFHLLDAHYYHGIAVGQRRRGDPGWCLRLDRCVHPAAQLISQSVPLHVLCRLATEEGKEEVSG